MEKQIRIIDQRSKEKYMIDDAYLNGYARLCGWKATLVYNSLCRHVNKDQFCFPSIRLMADEHNVSLDTIVDGVKILKEWSIIEVSEQTRDENGLWRKSIYTLLDKSVWKKKPSGFDNSISVTDSILAVNGVANIEHKETHIKETHKERERYTPSQFSQEFISTWNKATGKSWRVVKGLEKELGRLLGRPYTQAEILQAAANVKGTWYEDKPPFLALREKNKAGYQDVIGELLNRKKERRQGW